MSDSRSTRGRWIAAVALLAAGGCRVAGPVEVRPEPPAASAPAARTAAPAVAASSAPPPAEGEPGEAASEAPPPPDERVTSRSGRLTAWTRGGQEVWVKDASGERRLVAGGPLRVENAGANLPALDEGYVASLALSPDEQRVYFQRGGWATSGALFYAEVATGKVHFFHDANGYQVIERCRDRSLVGKVITFEHSYFDIVPASAADLFFLVDDAAPRPDEPRTGPSGRRGPIGFRDDNVRRFLARSCGVGQAPPAPASPPLPARLRGGSFRCQGETFRRDDLRLLDGTTEVRFVAATADGPQVLSLPDAIEGCGGV